jgi:hypothetical protein
MNPISFTYLNGPDIEQLALTDAEVLAAVERSLKAQGDGETVIEPRVHLVPEHSSKGHFNILRGYVKPLGLAGVKVVGDFVDNYKRDLPSELAILTLLDPETGVPKALLAHLIRGKAGIRWRVSRKLLILFTGLGVKTKQFPLSREPHPPCPKIPSCRSVSQPSGARKSQAHSMADA